MTDQSFKVEDEGLLEAMAVLVGLGSQDGGGVEGSDDGRQASGMLELAVRFGDLEFGAEEGLGSYGSEADDEFRTDGFDLGFEPRAAGVDFFHAGFLMDAEFAAGFPFEVFDGVGDVDLAAIDAGVFEALVEEFSSGADERSSLLVFLVTGLFADHHDVGADVGGFGFSFEFTEDCLGGVAIEVAAMAVLNGFLEGGQGALLWHERSCAWDRGCCHDHSLG